MLLSCNVASKPNPKSGEHPFSASRRLVGSVGIAPQPASFSTSPAVRRGVWRTPVVQTNLFNIFILNIIKTSLFPWFFYDFIRTISGSDVEGSEKKNNQLLFVCFLFFFWFKFAFIECAVLNLKDPEKAKVVAVLLSDGLIATTEPRCMIIKITVIALLYNTTLSIVLIESIKSMQTIWILRQLFENNHPELTFLIAPAETTSSHVVRWKRGLFPDL